MRYREAHWREDVEEFENHVQNEFAKKALSADRGAKRRMEQKVAHIVSGFKLKQESINKNLYRIIETVQGGLSEANTKRLDNYAVGVSMMIEGFLKAKNTTELLTIVALYNEGHFDGIFDKKEKAINESKSSPCSNHDTETASVVNEQE